MARRPPSPRPLPLPPPGTPAATTGVPSSGGRRGCPISVRSANAATMRQRARAARVDVGATGRGGGGAGLVAPLRGVPPSALGDALPGVPPHPTFVRLPRAGHCPRRGCRGPAALWLARHLVPRGCGERRHDIRVGGVHPVGGFGRNGPVLLVPPPPPTGQCLDGVSVRGQAPRLLVPPRLVGSPPPCVAGWQAHGAGARVQGDGFPRGIIPTRTNRLWRPRSATPPAGCPSLARCRGRAVHTCQSSRPSPPPPPASLRSRLGAAALAHRSLSATRSSRCSSPGCPSLSTYPPAPTAGGRRCALRNAFPPLPPLPWRQSPTPLSWRVQERVRDRPVPPAGGQRHAHLTVLGCHGGRGARCHLRRRHHRVAARRSGVEGRPAEPLATPQRLARCDQVCHPSRVPVDGGAVHGRQPISPSAAAADAGDAAAHSVATTQPWPPAATALCGVVSPAASSTQAETPATTSAVRACAQQQPLLLQRATPSSLPRAPHPRLDRRDRRDHLTAVAAVCRGVVSGLPTKHWEGRC